MTLGQLLQTNEKILLWASVRQKVKDGEKGPGPEKIGNITSDQASIKSKTSKIILQAASVVSSTKCDSTDPMKIMYIRVHFRSELLRKLGSSINSLELDTEGNVEYL